MFLATPKTVNLPVKGMPLVRCAQVVQTISIKYPLIRNKEAVRSQRFFGLQRYAQNEIQLADQESCAIDALKTCVNTCDADSVDPHTESECATSLSTNPQRNHRRSRLGCHYVPTVNDEYHENNGHSRDCVNQQVSACVSECQAQGEEELLATSAFLINTFPKSNSQCTDLQGGIDMDLEVEAGEAVLRRCNAKWRLCWKVWKLQVYLSCRCVERSRAYFDRFS